MIGVEGRIQVTPYQDQNGNNRQSFDIFVESVANLEPKKGDGFQPQPPFESGFQPSGSYSSQQDNKPFESSDSSTVEFEVSEDDLPF